MSYTGRFSHATAASEAPDGRSRTRFAGGHVRNAGATQVATVGGSICLIEGAPTFADPELATIAQSLGVAHAWARAFASRGVGAPALARGRFAVVLVQPAERRLFMANDRFGTWPICFSENDGVLEFSDRADTVCAVRRGLAPQALFDYLYYHCIPAPRTVYKGVHRLPAGHVADWDAGTLRVSRYWQPRFDEAASPDLDESKRKFLDIVFRSVQREAGDGRVGAFLSGGTDSSTVSGMLCRALGEPADTYSIGFDASGYDEMAYARIAAQHFGTRHHEYYVTADDLLEGIPKVAARYDQPFGNSSAVPAWVCARRAREDGIDKLLAGDGGDELFGGNSRYAKQRVFGAYDHVPGFLRGGVLEPFPPRQNGCRPDRTNNRGRR